MQIVLGLDGSEESIEAARFLTRLPTPDGVYVTVVSVTVEPQFELASAESTIQLRDVLSDTSRKHYENVASILGSAGIASEHVIAVGHPNYILLDEAKQRDADLIVVGSLGHSALARALIGSTSDYIANHARCSVLVARPPNEAHAADAPLRVVLAYDGSPGAEVAVEQMFGMAWPADSVLQITTLLERPSMLPDDVVYDQSAISGAQAKLDALVAAAKCRMPVTCTVRETRHVGGAIASLAEREDGDIIFVGDTGKSALAKFFLGSATRHVLYHSPCSVWVARRKHWQ